MDYIWIDPLSREYEGFVGGRAGIFGDVCSQEFWVPSPKKCNPTQSDSLRILSCVPCPFRGRQHSTFLVRFHVRQKLWKQCWNFSLCLQQHDCAQSAAAADAISLPMICDRCDSGGALLLPLLPAPNQTFWQEHAP